MLVQLSIRDIVLIDKLDLALGAGLMVLTGETGAGKSILLDAFALALGSRGDGALVRHGQPQGQVTAAFDVEANHPARRLVEAADMDVDGDMILRRVQMADGRTRAFINDRPVSAQTLRAVGAALVEIHGQHDDRALVDASRHRNLLDDFGGLGGQTSEVREAWSVWRAAQSERTQETARLEKARLEADYLRHAHAELDKLAPHDGEEETLAARRAQMMQAEKVTSELREAHEALAGEHAPTPHLAGVLRRLERRAAQAPELIEASLKSLDQAIDALEAAEQTLAAALREAKFDPRELERVEERLFGLRAAARKYSTPVDKLVALTQKFAADLTALDKSEARLKQLMAEETQAGERFAAKAAALSAARKKAAAALDKAVNRELAPLKLERAAFLTQIGAEAGAGPEGLDRVEFWVQTNPGTKPGPLMKIASGGELARFMLALKVALADRGSAPTLVFDEIDTGVGGAVADAIGQRLLALASRVQVLAVTHAPQVAARAGGHFRIAKDDADKGKRVATRIARLEPAARQEEIARMLSGAKVTDEARAAAGRLLESAG